MPRFVYMKPVVVPCPDCGTIEGRNYARFLNWLVDAENMDRLLTWVREAPCHTCVIHRRRTPRKKKEMIITTIDEGKALNALKNAIRKATVALDRLPQKIYPVDLETIAVKTALSTLLYEADAKGLLPSEVSLVYRSCNRLWEDDTMVAVLQRKDGRYQLVELPARSCNITIGKQIFSHTDDADLAIADNYDRSVLSVQMEDILDEITNRRVNQQLDKAKEAAE